MIEILDELRASLDYELFQFAEKDVAVIDQVVEAQRVALEKEICIGSVHRVVCIPVSSED
ncbi:MAG: hypothetical protein ABI162_13935 [Luteolibacter sp.]